RYHGLTYVEPFGLDRVDGRGSNRDFGAPVFEDSAHRPVLVSDEVLRRQHQEDPRLALRARRGLARRFLRWEGFGVEGRAWERWGHFGWWRLRLACGVRGSDQRVLRCGTFRGRSRLKEGDHTDGDSKQHACSDEGNPPPARALADHGLGWRGLLTTGNAE